MKSIIPSLLIILLLSSCSKSGSSSNNPTVTTLPPGTITGTLIDSPIGGVYYQTPTFSGMTDDSGKYNCLSEEMVQFYLKGDNGEEISVGEVGCSGVVSPIELATGGRFNIETDIDSIPLSDKKAVIGMLRLFQSLNASSNISQGITISSSDVSALALHFGSNGKTLDTAISLLINSSSFESELESAMGDIGKEVVSEEDAIEHFVSNQSVCNQNGCTPPVVIPPIVVAPVVDQCLQGSSYVQQTFTINGLVNSINNVLDGTGNPLAGSGFLAKASTYIQLKADHSALIYRVKSGSTYYRYSAIWSVDSSGRLSVDNINFPNGVYNWYFGAMVTNGGIMQRIATPQTLGASDDNFQRTWYVQEGCYPPSQIEVVGGL